MNIGKSKFSGIFICSFILTLFSCSKDSDLLLDAVLENSDGSITVGEGISPSPLVEDGIELRTTSFYPLNDAHVQEGKGYNQNIIRLEEGNRTSYLMFDISAIDSIGGQVTNAKLQITINSDKGNGNISVFKGKSNDWSENTITETNTPETSMKLGEITKEYTIGTTEEIILDTKNLKAEIATLILDHQDGNDLAFASKEHPLKIGPKLVVTYKAPSDAEDITPEELTTDKEGNNTNEAPMAIADATPSSGKAPLKVFFSGDNSTDDSNTLAYQWNFKDGTNTTDQNPEHTFTELGTYEVELTVTDNEGLTNTDVVTITVSNEANETPIALISSNKTAGEAPLTVEFNGNQSTDNNAISSYTWDFKDGAINTSINPSHTFHNAGIYEVELTVKDEQGASNTESLTITVSANKTGSNGNYPSHAVLASSFGFQADDATEAFEMAMKSNNSFIVIDKQSSDWVIEPTKFFDTRNKTIIFEPGVVLRAKSGAFGGSNDNLIALVRPENLIIEGYNATFQMNKNEYNSGEFRHTFSIWGGENITIRGLTFKDSGGDGIFIGRSDAKSYSGNITIEDVVCSNNRRQGMSIISAQNVWVRNSQFIGTSGANPEAGVDLEPDNPDERLVNINFSNCKFANNDSYGLLLATLKLNSTSTPISVTVKDSEFSYNFKSPNSSFIRSEVHFNQARGNNAVKGEVRFENVTFNGSQYSAVSSRKSAESYNVIFRDCLAKNVAQSGSPAISLEAHESASTLGGFDFGNFRVEYNSNTSFMKINAPSGSFRVKDIKGNFTVIEPNDNPIDYTGGYRETNNSNVDINYTHQ